MKDARFISISEQVAEHLRSELQRGRWEGLMPGMPRLSKELQVNPKTVAVALQQLEKMGLLLPQGPGKRRVIVPPEQSREPRALRIAILTCDASDLRLDYMVEVAHKLSEAGHMVVVPPKCLTELGMDVLRVARMVKAVEADAWIVMGAPGKVLECVADAGRPVFALFGRRRGLEIAGVGPNKPPVMAAIVRKLVGLGHRRVVLLARSQRRLPAPGASERAFLDELSLHGIAAGSFHLPPWEETIEGFDTCLRSLFRITPPTALIIDEAAFFVAALLFLARHGMRVPEDVSLVCTDADPAFAWCRPSVAHIRWSSRPVVRRIVSWVSAVSRGGVDKRQTLTAAEFVPGGTIGPAKEGN